MTAQNLSKSWFLAQTKPNSAEIADKNLRRQGFETFLPLEDTTLQRQGKFVTSLHPLFPGYIFLAFDQSKGPWRTINATRGVTQLVQFGLEPAAVPHDLISRLMERCDPSGRLVAKNLPKPGDHVTLTTGPFADFVAEIETIDKDQRAWVLMDLMGSKTRVKANIAQMRLE